MPHSLIPYLARLRGQSGLTMHQHRQIESDLNRLTDLEAENASLREQLAIMERSPKGRAKEQTV